MLKITISASDPEMRLEHDVDKEPEKKRPKKKRKKPPNEAEGKKEE